MSEESNIDDFGELFAMFAKELRENPIEIESNFKYPMEIKDIKKIPIKNVNSAETGSLVKIRPCAEEYKDKTYVGIYIGEIPVEFNVSLCIKTDILNLMNISNPAIFVPELKKVIFGYESWWGKIESEEELKQITDDDINNVFYVKMLKQLSEKLDGTDKRTKDNQVPGKDK